MEAQSVGEATQQLWDDTLTRLLRLSSATVKRNAELEARVAELEVEAQIWKQQAHSAAHNASQAHNVKMAALHRQIANLDGFKTISNQNPLILCIVNGDELVFNQELLTQGFQGGRIAAQEITKAIAEHLMQEEIHVYGKLSFWITIYYTKVDLVETLTSNDICSTDQLEAFMAGFSQASARFSVVDAGYSKEATESKIKECIQTFLHFPQTIRLFFGGYDSSESTYTPLFNCLENEQLLGRMALISPGYEQANSRHETVPLARLPLNNLFMTERLQRTPGSKKLSPLSTTHHFGNLKASGGLISPQSPERVPIGRPIDPSLPLHKQNPPPCNEHYLMTCSKTSGTCRYSHDYMLTPDQIAQLAINAKKAPCNWLKNGAPCPHGDSCCWGHVCPNGIKCFHLSKGKCWFKAEGMHGEGSTGSPSGST